MSARVAPIIEIDNIANNSTLGLTFTAYGTYDESRFKKAGGGRPFTLTIVGDVNGAQGAATFENGHWQMEFTIANPINDARLVVELKADGTPLDEAAPST
jgi:hypothetical protein